MPRAEGRAWPAEPGAVALAALQAATPAAEHRWPAQVVAGAARAHVDVRDAAAHGVRPARNAVGVRLRAGEEVHAGEGAVEAVVEPCSALAVSAPGESPPSPRGEVRSWAVVMGG